MADHAGTASATGPVQALPLRQLALPWIAVAALAAVAWSVMPAMLARIGRPATRLGARDGTR
jgi:hypothetical protein